MYISSLNSIVGQDFDGFKVVVSAYHNSSECLQKLKLTFDDKIEIVQYQHNKELPLHVNVTFNKTVQECVKKFGNFEYYLYVDSGCHFYDSGREKHGNKVLQEAYSTLKQNQNYAMASYRVDRDFKPHAIPVPDTPGQDFVMPPGTAVNGHLNFFHNDMYEAFNKKLWPDVFKADCSESVFTYLCGAVNKRWIILKDIVLQHKPDVDGASNSYPRLRGAAHWNNLMFDRDIQDMIQSTEAIEAGMGYEELWKIMPHNVECYDEDGNAKYPKKLKKVVNEFLFLNDTELDYDDIDVKIGL